MKMAEDTILYTKDDTSGEYVEYTAPSFQDRLPEDLKGNEVLGDFSNSIDVAKAYVDLKSSLPQVPDDYEIANLPEDIPVDRQGIDDFKALAKELGISQEAFSKLIEFDLERAKRIQQEFSSVQEQAKAEAEASLKKEWGTDYNTNMEIVSKAIRTFIDEDIEKKLADAGFMDNPDVAKVFLRVGKAISEGTFIPGQQIPPGIETDEYGRPMLSFPSMEK